MDQKQGNNPRDPHKTPQPEQDVHEGATEEQVGDRRGPGPGYDQEPEEVTEKGGVVS